MQALPDDIDQLKQLLTESREALAAAEHELRARDRQIEALKLQLDELRARDADPDSGSCQFFIALENIPRLDGRYTIFGELRQGFAVLDAIEVGDRILGVRVRGAEDTP